jgi:flagellar P-ring protein precursor FlgI
LQLKNVATVVVTAQLPAFAQPGQIDVNVSSMGNSKSLKGGTLITTPAARCRRRDLRPGPGQPGGGRRRRLGRRQQGADQPPERWPHSQGAQVERTVPTPLHDRRHHHLGLNASDFQTASKVAQAINAKLGDGTATALDGRTVQVRAPQDPGARVGFIAELEELPLENSVPTAKVVINARTGSIVLNQAVTLGSCAIAHGNLSITISSTPVISQPNPLSQGQTVVAQKSDIPSSRKPGNIIQMPPSAQLADVVRASTPWAPRRRTCWPSCRPSRPPAP